MDGSGKNKRKLDESDLVDDVNIIKRPLLEEPPKVGDVLRIDDNPQEVRPQVENGPQVEDDTHMKNGLNDGGDPQIEVDPPAEDRPLMENGHKVEDGPQMKNGLNAADGSQMETGSKVEGGPRVEEGTQMEVCAESESGADATTHTSTQAEPTLSLIHMPDQILLEIFAYCSPQALKALSFTCERFYCVARDRTLWARADLRHSPVGMRRLAWYLTHCLHEGTSYLAVNGYSEELKDCLGVVTRKPRSRSLGEGEARCCLHPQGADGVIRSCRNAGLGGSGPDPPAQGSKAGEEGEGESTRRPRSETRQQKRPGQRDGSAPGRADDQQPGSSEGIPEPEPEQACPGPMYTLNRPILVELYTRCPNITELILDYCNFNNSLTNLSQFPPMLRRLSLRGSHLHHTNQSKTLVFQIHQNLPHLEFIDLSWCDWLTPETLLSLSKLEYLKTLVVTNCGRLQDFIAYASLATKYGFRRLEVADFRFSPVGDSEVSALGWLPRLRELYLQSPDCEAEPLGEHPAARGAAPAPRAGFATGPTGFTPVFECPSRPAFYPECPSGSAAGHTPRRHQHSPSETLPPRDDRDVWELEEVPYMVIERPDSLYDTVSPLNSNQDEQTHTHNSNTKKQESKNDSNRGSHSSCGGVSKSDIVKLVFHRQTYTERRARPSNRRAEADRDPEDEEVEVDDRAVKGDQAKVKVDKGDDEGDKDKGEGGKDKGEGGNDKGEGGNDKGEGENDEDDGENDDGEAESDKSYDSSSNGDDDGDSDNYAHDNAINIEMGMRMARQQVEDMLRAESAKTGCQFEISDGYQAMIQVKFNHSNPGQDNAQAGTSKQKDGDATAEDKPSDAKTPAEDQPSTSQSKADDSDSTNAVKCDAEAQTDTAYVSDGAANEKLKPNDDEKAEKKDDQSSEKAATDQAEKVEPRQAGDDEAHDEGPHPEVPINPLPPNPRLRAMLGHMNFDVPPDMPIAVFSLQVNRVNEEGAPPPPANQEEQPPHFVLNLEDRRQLAMDGILQGQVGNVRMFANVGGRNWNCREIGDRALPLMREFGAALAATLPRSLVSDAAIRYFGRSRVVGFVHIGRGGPMPSLRNEARPHESQLTRLVLVGYSGITNATLQHLITAAPHLTHLDVRNTRITEAAVRQFQNVRPDVEVLYGPY